MPSSDTPTLDLLLLDDDEEFLALLTELLAPHCSRVRAVSSASAAVRAVMSEPPDVLISDFRLSDQATAAPALKLVAQLRPDIRVVLLSASAASEYQELLKSGVVSCVLIKPARLDELLEAIALITQGPRASQVG